MVIARHLRRETQRKMGEGAFDNLKKLKIAYVMHLNQD